MGQKMSCCFSGKLSKSEKQDLIKELKKMAFPADVKLKLRKVKYDNKIAFTWIEQQIHTTIRTRIFRLTFDQKLSCRVAFKICIYLASINYLLAIRNDGDQMDFQEPKIIKQEKEDDSD